MKRILKFNNYSRINESKLSEEDIEELNKLSEEDIKKLKEMPKYKGKSKSQIIMMVHAEFQESGKMGMSEEDVEKFIKNELEKNK